jgi:hypothetical protein
MKLLTFRAFLSARYEHLFARRFRLENERDMDTREDGTQLRRRRRRFWNAGSIFPTESILPRYQY